MRHFDNFLAIMFLLLFCVSCDPGIQVTYQLKNGADKDIKINYIIAEPGNNDTVKIVLVPNQIKIITAYEALGTPKYYDRDRDSIYELRYIFVQKDTLVSYKNFKDRNEWNYNTTGKHSATYELLIDNTDF